MKKGYNKHECTRKDNYDEKLRDAMAEDNGYTQVDEIPEVNYDRYIKNAGGKKDA